MCSVTHPVSSEALPDKARDLARQWARRAVLGIVHESGGRIVARPVFRSQPDLDLTVADADAISGLEAATKLTSAVRRLILDYARHAREDGRSWREIGLAIGLGNVADAGGDVADAAYDDLAGTPAFAQSAFAWVCPACRNTVIDRGPQAGHPADCEDGHADGCPRLAAAVDAWNAARGDEGGHQP
jgi:hypothetical protein